MQLPNEYQIKHF